MYPEFSIPKSESDFTNCVQQSNEILIPRPLALCFNYPEHPAGSAYLTNLTRELELKSRLFDKDRTILQLNWICGSKGVNEIEIRDLLVTLSKRFFRFDSNYTASPIDDYEGVEFDLDLVGLGVGAISRIEGILFQNTTNPARYRAQLSRWRLPVAHGHRGST
jgi:coproporphyrinogen III oxidase-like Fe-S oxidoreductase